MAIEIALAIEREAGATPRRELPDLADVTAIYARTRCHVYFDGAGWLVLRVVFDRQQAISSGPTMEHSDIDFVKRKIEGITSYNPASVARILGSDWVSPDRFTYVGPYELVHMIPGEFPGPIYHSA